MTSRRRAIAEFLVSAVALFVQAYSWKRLKQRGDADDPPALSVAGLVAGAFYQIGFYWAYDRDIGYIRSNSYRALLYEICSELIRRWMFNSKEFRYSFSSGGLAGTILYRLWYGVLHPVPDSEE